MNGGIVFAAKIRIMRRLLNILLTIVLVGLTVPQEVGVSLERCMHSGRVSFSAAPMEMECGMGSDSDCAIHFQFKVSDFSQVDSGFDIAPLPSAYLSGYPVLICDLFTEGYTPVFAEAESPPGGISHIPFQLRN